MKALTKFECLHKLDLGNVSPEFLIIIFLRMLTLGLPNLEHYDYEIRTIFNQCLDRKPANRPSFDELRKRFLWLKVNFKGDADPNDSSSWKYPNRNSSNNFSHWVR